LLKSPSEWKQISLRDPSYSDFILYYLTYSFIARVAVSVRVYL
jgi:hypothetical protein